MKHLVMNTPIAGRFSQRDARMAVNRNINAQRQLDGPASGGLLPLDSAAPRRPSGQCFQLHAIAQEHFQLDEAILKMMQTAALSQGSLACSQAVKAALGAGISREDVADHYIPELSRRLGDEWCDDQLGFAPVTIASARLQFMLRELGPDWSGDKIADPFAPTILLIVPRNVHHTMGAMVVAGQMRRKGLSVRLLLDATTLEIAECVRRTSFDAVFVSAPLGETIESLRLIVRVVKSTLNGAAPVVIGGTLLDLEPRQTLAGRTGADYATKSPDEALELCGLRAIARTNAIRPVRGG